MSTELLLRARHRAGLSQAELARRAGLPRSVLNAYEHGRREPGGDTLARIVAAAGSELRIAPAVRLPDPHRAPNVLADVLDLAERLPTTRRRRLLFPPFASRVP